jgi:hypothetical protein
MQASKSKSTAPRTRTDKVERLPPRRRVLRQYHIPLLLPRLRLGRRLRRRDGAQRLRQRRVDANAKPLLRAGAVARAHHVAVHARRQRAAAAAGEHAVRAGHAVEADAIRHAHGRVGGQGLPSGAATERGRGAEERGAERGREAVDGLLQA